MLHATETGLMQQNCFMKMLHATTIFATNLFHATQNICWNLLLQQNFLLYLLRHRKFFMQQCCACQNFSTCTTNVVQQLRNKGSNPVLRVNSCSTSSRKLNIKTIYKYSFIQFKVVPAWPGLRPKIFCRLGMAGQVRPGPGRYWEA